jgi:hypothetical protein
MLIETTRYFNILYYIIAHAYYEVNNVHTKKHKLLQKQHMRVTYYSHFLRGIFSVLASLPFEKMLKFQQSDKAF